MNPKQKQAILALAEKAKKGETSAKDVPVLGVTIAQLVDAVERAETSQRDLFAADASGGNVARIAHGSLTAKEVAKISFQIADAMMVERARPAANVSEHRDTLQRAGEIAERAKAEETEAPDPERNALVG